MSEQRMIRFDDVVTPLTESMEAGLVAYMKAFTAAMRAAEPNLAGCWTSGRAHLPADLSTGDLSFRFGGDIDFEDGLGRFAVVVAPEP